MKNYVLYHKSCFDGMSSYLSAWLHFKDKAEYIACAYGDPFPELDDNSTVYFVDFSCKRKEMERLCRRMHKVIVLDHHLSCVQEIGDLELSNLEKVIDMDRSGAMITYQYFFPNQKVPKLIQYVQDRDIWKWELPQSKEINAAIGLHKMELKEYQLMAENDHWFEEFGEFYDMGYTLLVQNETYIERHLDNVFEIELDQHRVPCVNATVLYSDVATKLLEMYPDAPFVAYFIVRSADAIQWGLRSRDDFDCSEVAKKYGGGGHKKASGFVTGLAFLHRNVLHDACCTNV